MCWNSLDGLSAFFYQNLVEQPEVVEPYTRAEILEYVKLVDGSADATIDGLNLRRLAVRNDGDPVNTDD